MTSVPDIFSTMAYGPAPEAVAPAHAWLERHPGRSGLFIGAACPQPGA
jgi:aldehyde dehydrogenase (NAD+)